MKKIKKEIIKIVGFHIHPNLAKIKTDEIVKVFEKSGKLIYKPLHDRSQIIDLLEAYSKFLEKSGYMDTDWWQEEPFAIDEFLKQK